jgi:hypothetical protein
MLAVAEAGAQVGAVKTVAELLRIFEVKFAGGTDVSADLFEAR